MAGPVSPARRAAAARVRRQGGTQQQAADAARVDLRTFQRWEKQPDFPNLLHARGIMQAGPLRIVADDSAALDDVEADETILWIARETADVTGSLVVAEATHMRVVFVDPADVPTVHADLEAQRFPSIRDAHSARSPRPR